MTSEELQKALEAIGKGGINVNGDLVLEKHVEHEIGNVEAGGIGIQITNGMAPDVKESGKDNDGRPKRVGTTINKAFIYDAGDATTEPQDDETKERAAVLTGNSEFMAIMEKAVGQGFCSPKGWQYRWRVKADAAYFASVASHWFDLSNRHDHDGDKAISWIPFEALFAEKGLRLSYNDIKQCKTTLKHKADIDKLFR